MPAPRIAKPNAKERLVHLWHLARKEHCTPREVGIAVGLGLFACCSPMLGFHTVIAIGLATIFRVNRLWALVFSQASIFGLLRAPIMLAEIQTAHRLRTGQWLAISMDTIVHKAPSLFADWAIGAIPVGGAVGLLGGFAAYAISRRRQFQIERLSELPPTVKS